MVYRSYVIHVWVLEIRKMVRFPIIPEEHLKLDFLDKRQSIHGHLEANPKEFIETEVVFDVPPLQTSYVVPVINPILDIRCESEDTFR